MRQSSTSGCEVLRLRHAAVYDTGHRWGSVRPPEPVDHPGRCTGGEMESGARGQTGGKGENVVVEEGRGGRQMSMAGEVRASGCSGSPHHRARERVTVLLITLRSALQSPVYSHRPHESAGKCRVHGISALLRRGHAGGAYPGFGLNAEVQQEGEQCDRHDRGPPGEQVHVRVIVGLKDSGVLDL